VAELTELLATLDPDPRIRGRQFEEICAWFLRNDPLYQYQLDRVWLWDAWPGRWAADAGIDLVGLSVDGSLWAIQAKAYGDAYSITKADVDTFLSESARPDFSFRLLVATTNHLGATARRTIAAQEKPVHLLLRSQLDAAQVQWPRTPQDLRPSAPVPKELRPHQLEAVEAVRRGFDRDSRGQLVRGRLGISYPVLRK
jgi:predicted helicase